MEEVDWLELLANEENHVEMGVLVVVEVVLGEKLNGQCRLEEAAMALQMAHQKKGL